MSHLDSIHRRERAVELCEQAQNLANMGYLPECLAKIEEGLECHAQCKELLALKAEVEPRLAAIEEALEKAALRAAKRRHLKDKKREDMKLADAARVLGVAPDCRDEAVLKRAFKKESLRHHPDRNRGDADATRREGRRGQRARTRKTRARASREAREEVARWGLERAWCSRGGAVRVWPRGVNVGRERM